MADQSNTRPRVEDPSRTPLFDLLKTMTTGQVLGIIGFLGVLFTTGVGIGTWVANTTHDRELLSLANKHRDEIDQKNGLLKTAIADLSKVQSELINARNDRQSAQEQLVAAANDKAAIAEQSARLLRVARDEARAQRAKSAFLDRYVSYLSAPDTPMMDLFVAHVCALWRQTTTDILSVEEREVSLDEIAAGSALSPAVVESLVAAGVTRQMIEEYRALVRSAPSPIIVVRRVEPLPEVRQPNPDFERLQGLESILRSRISKFGLTKTVMFFDGTVYTIPRPIADEVHTNAECQS